MKRRKNQTNEQIGSERRLCITYRDHVIRTVALPTREPDGIISPPSAAAAFDFVESVPLDRIESCDIFRDPSNEESLTPTIIQQKIVVRRMSDEEIADVVDNGALSPYVQLHNNRIDNMFVGKRAEHEAAPTII